MKKWLFNPFVYVAGARSLVIGWAVMLLSAVISYYSKVHFTGVLDVKSASHTAPLFIHFLEPLIDWICLTAIFYSCGLLFSTSRIRFIDVAGTMALARWPLVFAAVIGFGIHAPASLRTIEEVTALITPAFIVFTILSLVIVIWMVALLYNAFSVSLNLKGGKAAGVFIGGLLVAEIIAELLFYFMSKHLTI